MKSLPKRCRILVSAGPTREKIDPVRFISNYSTGSFGYAIAGEAERLGHRVTLVSGPTSLLAPKGVRLVLVESALEMRKAMISLSKYADCIIMAAAVSDWRVKDPAKTKMKKGKGSTGLELVSNPDILKELGAKKGGRVLVGFALETEGLEKHARQKLREKNLDLVVANRLKPKKSVFGSSRTSILVVDRHGEKAEYRNKTKKALAKIILDKALR